jgi:diguanylate cyclase
MDKQISAASSIGLRVATAMYQMGIDGLPRNYELVYEAYSGANPELTKEFVGIGKNKTQRALDELGRKYLPHHHEETQVAKTNDRMRSQMTTFRSLLEEEKSSLSDYGKIISEASRTFAQEGQLDKETLNRSIQQLSEATERQASRSEAMVAEASEQAAQLDGVKADIENFERMKFLDSLTGLANRRSFNKARRGSTQTRNCP